MRDGESGSLPRSPARASGRGKEARWARASEANRVVDAFDGLAAPEQQDLLNFLRSL